MSNNIKEQTVRGSEVWTLTQRHKTWMNELEMRFSSKIENAARDTISNRT